MNEEKEQLADKLVRLHNQLDAKVKDKKTAAAAYRDEINEIKEEIADVVESLNTHLDDTE